MNLITTQVDLDFIFNDSRKAIPIVQGDDGGRQLAVNLYNNGTYVDVSALTDTVTLSAEVNGVRTVLRKELDISTVTGLGTRIVIPITADLSRLSGVEHCVLRISSSNGIVHAAAFDLLVLHNPLYTDNISVTTTGGSFETTALILQALWIANYYPFAVKDNPSLEESSPYILIPAPISQGSYENNDFTVAIAQNDTMLDPENDYNVGDVVGIPDTGENPSIHFYVRVDFNMAFRENDTVNISVKWSNE